MRRTFAVLLLLGLFACWRSVQAQDSNYWSEQYGTRSELLGGAVVGSPQDLSTTFYNPGGLSRLKTESFLLSAKALEYQRLTAKESSGRFTDLAHDRFGVAPSLFAGTFPRSWTTATLAYSLLTRQRFEFRIDNWTDLATSSFGDSVARNSYIDGRIAEQWGGLTWSRPAGDFGLGATLYGAYRSQRSRIEALEQPQSTGPSGVAVAFVDDYSYWHVRLLAKLGVHWEYEHISVGITFTTPGLPLFGDGKAAAYRSVVPIDSTSGVPTITEAIVANDPSVTYRSPASVAIGGRYGAGRNAFYVTLEWFDSVERYRVLDAPEVPDSGPGSLLGANITQELNSVVNFVVGYEYSPREQLTFYGSFLANFSSSTEDPGAAHTFSTWDIYQFTGGAAFTYQQMDFTLGASVAAGGEELNFQNDVWAAPIIDPVDIRYRRVRFFIGFEFGQ